MNAIKLQRRLRWRGGYALLFVAVLALLVAVANPVEAVSINFDSHSAMSNLPGSPVPAQLSNFFLSSTGAVFSSVSGTPYVAVVNIGAGAILSAPNGIGGVDASGNLSYSSMRVEFFDPSNPAVQAVTNFASIRGDLIPAAGTISLQAFDVNGLLLGTDTQPDAPGGTLLSVSFSRIHSLVISSTSATVAFDDLTFNSVAAVPEPSTGAVP